MDISKLLAPKLCSCGKIHRCDIKYVFIGENALSHLGEMTEGYNNVLIVADENTYAVAGEKSEAELIGKSIKRQVFSGKTLLIPDEAAVKAVKAHLDGIEIIIGIGSGVIQDLCKYISFYENIPYYIVATAPSMDGYASGVAAMIMGGMKTSFSAKVPDGFIGDTEILKNAPIDMIRSGYGDIVGKYSALCDWKIAKTVRDEYFCPFIYELTMQMLLEVLPLSKKLLMRDEAAIQTLTEALIGVGITMAYAENSRPASGSEHHLSHFFEITGILNNEAYLPHGTDVFFSTYITALLRERLLSAKLPEKPFEMSDDYYKSEISRVYKDIADGCIRLHEKTGWYKENRLPIYREKWNELKKILSEMPSSDEILSLLSGVSFNVNDFYNMYGKEKICDAVTYAKDLKDRFTILWLYYDIFGKEALL